MDLQIDSTKGCKLVLKFKLSLKMGQRALLAEALSEKSSANMPPTFAAASQIR